MMLQPQQQHKVEDPPKIGHQRTPTAEDFPLPAKQLLATSSANRSAAVTPAKSSFTFSDIEEQMPGYSKSRPGSRQGSRPGSSQQQHHSPGTRIGRIDTHELTQKSSVDAIRRQENSGRKMSSASTTETIQRPDVLRNRSATSVLPFREVSHGAREKVHRDSTILAEVKTNIIIRDEFLFLKEFSSNLSARYQKPLSSIFVTLDHSACLLFANSFDSAYILTITALPSQIVASANKRNAALIQSFMTSALGVLPDRGLVKFVGLGDDYLATAGTTFQGQAERLERVLSLNDNNISPTSSNKDQERKPPDMPLPQTPPVNMKGSPSGPIPPPRMTSQGVSSGLGKKKPPALRLVPKSQSMPGSKMPSPVMMDSPAALPQIPPSLPRSKTPSIFDRRAEKMRGSGRRKSILALFGRGSG